MAFSYASGAEAGKVGVTGTIVHTGQKAILLMRGGKKVWLPKRFCTVREQPDGTQEVLMPKWLAKRSGYVG